MAKVEIELAHISCARIGCNMDFFVSQEFISRLQDNHQNFFCPQGHPNHYLKKTTEDLLREQLANIRRMKDDEIALLKTKLRQRKKK